MLLLLLWDQVPHHQQQQRGFSGGPGPVCGALLAEGETSLGPPWLTSFTASSFPSFSKIKTLDKAGVLHRTMTVDKGKRVR